ncbi:MAG: hypothetical protein A3D24_01510 [Candidatus Blackburnbacteria bacterium RIFCSPHIGHO2_02_FULL_39_13]|nr:MAG: hypothetical protein A3D24_01510 [Candidatus Blackburnbacteria bacterium RIFCSPHIGHO2_02_FULL_39_13]
MQGKILLIEDEQYARDIYKRQLDLAGFTTDAFPNGKEGLAALANKYDLALIDLMLPDVNGVEILKQIKANESSKNTAVVFLTNLGQDSLIKEGFSLGIVAYLVKSNYTPNQLVQEVQNIMTKVSSSASQTTVPVQAPQTPIASPGSPVAPTLASPTPTPPQGINSTQ